MPGPTLRECSPLKQLGGVRRVLDVLDAALDLAHGVAGDLAVLGGEQRGDLFRVLLEQHLELAHHPRAPERRRVPPGRKRFRGRLHGGADLRCVGEEHALFGFSGRRVPDFLGATVGVRDGLAVDPVTDEGEL